MGQQVSQKLGNLFNEFNRLGERPNIAGHGWVAAGKVLETWNVVGVGQKSDIENQVTIGWNALTKPETCHINQNLRFLVLAAELLADEIPEFVDREFRGINDEVGHRPDGSQLGPLGADALGNRSSRPQRMRPAGLAK